MIKATYQVGVDVLGFPIYVIHEIYRGEENIGIFCKKKKFWVRVFERIIKQH